MLNLALYSLWNRRFVASLTVLSIALAVALILGVERLRDSARGSFANSASGIDLIVAPRGNDVQILMATVFGVGSTGTGMSWDSFERVENLPAVDWAVPLMMGDNHRGYPVMGTSRAYFEHFRHSGGQSLEFAQGGDFEAADSAVMGAEVATRFGYGIGTVFVNAHGAGNVSFDMHDDAPFTVTGVLAPTGTAVDRMVFISTEGFDGLHASYETPAADPFAAQENDDASSSLGGTDEDQAQDARGHDDDNHEDHGYEPNQINAIYVGLTERRAILGIQRALQTDATEALSAVMPNVALLQLWSITGTAENALRLMSVAVAAASLIGMVVMLSATLEARRREFAILRSVGATPGKIFGLIVSEALMMAVVGILIGIALLLLSTALANPILSANYGFRMGLALPSFSELTLLLAVFCVAALASLLPAWRVYRMTLSDGLAAKL
ncbi:ABC transporter permease [Shimia sp. Alg240-R146]|uniref:ABC transporter permease n=1 Tax=Shimia sp. Alg240-R146 TaxID=2993449 RepID=UPI0022E75388|nr:ABC transporter permease [Shimia sp. Alg240-R146]